MPTSISGPISLDRALDGQYSEFAPKDAVYQLARSGMAGAETRLVALAREQGPLPIRRRAALALSLMANPRHALLPLLDVREPAVLAAVLLALARVAQPEDLEPMRRAAGRLSGHEAEQSRFAVLLLAHRVGFGPEIVPTVVLQPERHLPTDTRSIDAGSRQEAEKAWSRFRPQAALGFEPAGLRSLLIKCPNSDILFIPAQDFHGENGSRAFKERMIAGATASYEREAGVWCHDLWILSIPTSTGIDLQGWTLGGQACYVGQAQVDQGELAFELATAAGSSLAIARIRGRLTNESLTLEGVVGDRPKGYARHAVPRERPTRNDHRR